MIAPVVSATGMQQTGPNTRSADNSVEAPSRSSRLPAGQMLVSTSSSMQLLDRGRQAIIDFRLHDAERSFTSLANLPDGRPAGLFHLAMVSFFRFLMSDSEADRFEFEQRSGELKRELDRLPDSPWRALLGAEMNLQRAVVRAKIGKYVRAALAARTAYQEYDRIVREYPSLYDGQKGYGLLKLAIGSMPGTYRRFLSLIGFKGSVEDGLAALDTAARKGNFSREEATAFVALSHILLLEPVNGIKGLERLHTDYPESALFTHLYGYVLFENRNAAEAEELFRWVVDREADHEYFFIDYAQYFLGMSLFRLNEFAEAEYHLGEYVRKHQGQALDAPATLHLAMSIEMQGRRMEAVSLYKQVQSDREFDLDAVSKRKAADLLREPLVGVVRALQTAANSFDAGKYEAATDVLVPLSRDQALSSEYRSEAYYRLGRVYHVTNAPDSALVAYREAVNLRSEARSRWAPWSEYYMGRIHEDRGAVDAAIAAYRRATEYGGKYDYYQALNNNARLGLQRLK
ncbi:MAG: DUF3808 domain-containing protein [Rhodothermales bacterium]|nr:DUF3808 domain-containing protein [Rhodothermales bacterium]